MEVTHVNHDFGPVFDDQSEVLILGTMPSVKSREQHFYYGHPRNRFWLVLAALTDDKVPDSIPEKEAFLLTHHIALWDVVESCDIKGSSDSSIRNVVPTDLSRILDHCRIRGIFANGNKAKELYERYSMERTGRQIIPLPSTSPANAAYSLEKLVDEWSKIRDIIA